MKEMDSLRQIWKKYGESCSCHGVPDLFQSPVWPTQLAWSALILFAFVNMILQTLIFVAEYRSSDPWTYGVSYERMDAIPYPNITFCNLNMINVTTIVNLPYPTKATAFIQPLLMALRKPYDTQYMPLVENGREPYLKAAQRYPSLYDLRKAVLPLSMTDCRGTFVLCSYGEYNRELNCCDMVEPIITGTDICQTFVPKYPGGILSSTAPGHENGLTVIVDPGLHYGPPLFPADTEEGFRVYFNYADNAIFASTDSVLLSPGAHVEVRWQFIRHTFKQPKGLYSSVLFPQEYPCFINGTMKIIDGDYSVSGCAADCEQQFSLINCNCTDVGPVKPQYNVCTPMQAYRCLRAYQSKYFSSENSSGINLWKRKTESRSGVRFPYWPLSNFSDDDYNRLIQVDFYFSSTAAQIVEVSLRFPIDELISQIGGTMGVWAGVSILTLVQLLTYIIQSAWYIFHHNLSSSSSTPSKSEKDAEQNKKVDRLGDYPARKSSNNGHPNRFHSRQLTPNKNCQYPEKRLPRTEFLPRDVMRKNQPIY